MTAFSVQSSTLDEAVHQACRRLDEARFAEALWTRRLEAWTHDPAVQQKIGGRLGWLDALSFITPRLPQLRAFAADIGRAGFTDVVLLGMGGSSLGPEVLRQVLGVATGFPRFRMLDSVDPDAVRAAMAHAGSSLFLLASKSGGTIEPNAMAAEARRRVIAAGHADWGSRFVAITDEDTVLHRRAVRERFREVFVNPADIGGRYSALSYFGMVPAALLGADLDALIAAARQMEAACRVPSAADNPGLTLGALMAAGAQTGRDKLTLLLPERLQSLGLWIEQLVAESTGKQGQGIVPIAGGHGNGALGSDRVAVAVTLGEAGPDPYVLERVRTAGVPLAAWAVPDVTAIGAEFLRWEVATAAAGFLLGINPFDEPNVQQAKDATGALLETYRARRHIPLLEPHAVVEGARLTLSRAALERLPGQHATSFLRLLRDGDYFGLLPYLPPDDPRFHATLDRYRTEVTERTGRASMLGYGPRYLHSTGQLHKGGANNGVFVIVTADADDDLAIPDEAFSFGVLEMAQAVGDFQSLDQAARRALHVHLPGRAPGTLERVMTALLPGA